MTRGSRYLRRALLLVIIASAAVAVLFWHATRPQTIMRTLLPIVQSLLGDDATIESVAYMGRGTISIRAIRVPGDDTYGTPAFSVEEASVALSILDAILGRPLHARSLLLRNMQCTLKRTPAGGYVWPPPYWHAAPSASRVSLPLSVVCTDIHLRIESYREDTSGSGTDDEEAALTRSLRFKMFHEQDTWNNSGEDIYRFQANEMDAPPDSTALSVGGTWNPADALLDISVPVLNLDNRLAELLPARIADLIDVHEVTGALKNLNWHLSLFARNTVDSTSPPSTPSSITGEIDHVSLEMSSVYADAFAPACLSGTTEPQPIRCRAYAQSGTLSMNRETLALDCVDCLFSPSHGESPDITPYKTTLSLQAEMVSSPAGTPHLSASKSPFHLALRFKDKGISVGGDSSVDTSLQLMPTFLSRLLASAGVISGQVQTGLNVSFTSTFDSDQQEIDLSAEINFKEVSATPPALPYPVNDAQGLLLICDTAIEFDHLVCRGSGKSSIEISGLVPHYSDHPNAALHISASSLPIDAVLRNALPDREMGYYDSLFHNPSLSHLQPTDKLDSTDGNRWGLLDLDLSITRPLSNVYDKSDLNVEGTIGIDHVMLLHESFPYPLFIGPGELTIDSSRVVLGSDSAPMSIHTQGNGSGVLTGEILLASSADTSPNLNLSLHVQNVDIDNLLASCLTGSIPDDSALFMEMVQLRGIIKSADINLLLEEADKHPVITADVRITDGTATPSAWLQQALGTTTSVLPADGILHALDLDIRYASKTLNVLQASGQIGPYACSLEGELSAGSHVLRIHLDDWPIDDGFLHIASPGDASMLRLLRNEHELSGNYDLDLTRRLSGNNATLSGELRPVNVRLRLGGAMTKLEPAGGSVSFDSQSLFLDDLAFLFPDNPSAGAFTIAMSYVMDDKEMAFQYGSLSWPDARLESMLVRELIDRGPGGLRAWYEDHVVGGEFGVDIHFLQLEEPRAWEYTITPRALTLHAGNDDATYMFSPGAFLEGTQDKLTIQPLTASSALHNLTISGIASGNPVRSAVLLASSTGPLSHPAITSLLHPAVQGILDDLKYRDDAGTSINNARLALIALENDDWLVKADGDIMFHDARCHAGTAMADLNGSLEVHYASSPSSGSSLTVSSDAIDARILGQNFHDINMESSWHSRDARYILHTVSGYAGSGSFSLFGESRTTSPSDYNLSIHIDDLPLEDFNWDNLPASEVSDDGPRPSGLFDLRLDLAGVRGDPSTMHGEGSAQVSAGSIADVPAALRILQFLRLSEPASSFRSCESSLKIEGTILNLHDLHIDSTSSGSNLVQRLQGEGYYDLEAMEMDILLGMTSRGGLLPDFIQEIVTLVSDELAVLRLQGILGDPTITLVPLPGLRDIEILE